MPAVTGNHPASTLAPTSLSTFITALELQCGVLGRYLAHWGGRVTVGLYNHYDAQGAELARDGEGRFLPCPHCGSDPRPALVTTDYRLDIETSRERTARLLHSSWTCVGAEPADSRLYAQPWSCPAPLASCDMPPRAADWFAHVPTGGAS